MIPTRSLMITTTTLLSQVLSSLSVNVTSKTLSLSTLWTSKSVAPTRTIWFENEAVCIYIRHIFAKY